MPRNMLRWAGGAVAGAAVVGLGVYFAVVGLDRADKAASVVGTFVALAGLAVAVYGTRSARRPLEPPEGEGGRPITAVRNEISGGTVHGAVIQAGDVSGSLFIGRPGSPAPESPQDPAPPDDGS